MEVKTMKVKKLMITLASVAMLTACGNNVVKDKGDLSGISVTAPTKVSYSVGEQLDLSGLVVTADYANQSGVTISEGFTTDAAEIDMKVSGEHTITVTFEGQTATFTINVVAPTDWEDSVKALFTEKLNGIAVPYFYAYDLGLGDLTWTTEGDVVVATGGKVTVDTKGTASTKDDVLKEPEAVFQVFKAAQWNVFSDGKVYWHYEVDAPVTVGQDTFYVDAKFGAYDSEKGTFGGTGNFRLELQKPYVSWTDSGFSAMLAEFFEVESFPALAGLFDKREVAYYSGEEALEKYYKANGSIDVTARHVSEAELEALMSAMYADQNWILAQASETSDYDYVAVSVDNKLRADVAISDDGTVEFAFSVPGEIPEMVQIVAAETDCPAFAFVESGSYYSYVLEVSEALEAMQLTLVQLRDYVASGLISEQAPYKFTLVKTEDDAEKNEYSKRFVYESPTLNIDVYVEAEISDDEDDPGKYVGVYITEYHPVPEGIASICSVLGVDIYDLHVDSRTQEFFVDIEEGIPQDKTLRQIAEIYAALLDADYAKGAEAIAAMQPNGDPTSTKQYYLIEYTNSSYAIQLYAFTTKDDDNKTIKCVEIVFNERVEDPQSAWAKSIAELLHIEFKWDGRDKCYTFEEQITLEGEVDTLAKYASAVATQIAAADLAETLSVGDFQGGGREVKLYGETGYISVYTYNSQDEPSVPKCLISVYLYEHQQYPIYINAISAALEQTLTPVEGKENEYSYSGYSTGYWLVSYGYKSFTTDYQTILGNTETGNLLNAQGLGFELDDLKMVGSDMVAVLVNDDGYTITITYLADSKGDWNQKVTIVVSYVAPAQA